MLFSEGALSCTCINLLFKSPHYAHFITQCYFVILFIIGFILGVFCKYYSVYVHILVQYILHMCLDRYCV